MRRNSRNSEYCGMSRWIFSPTWTRWTSLVCSKWICLESKAIGFWPALLEKWGGFMTHRCSTSSPIVCSDRACNDRCRACHKKLSGPKSAKQMKKNCSSNMRSILDAVTAATITAHPFWFKIISTAVGVAIILDNASRTKKMKSSWKPKHVEDC